jgi:NAD(P)-dependent dehydrogenase (short-subunit alcohol dehydrogenase family)
MTKIAIVTGGASGIGAALSLELVRAGDLVVLADVDAAGADTTAERLNAEGPGSAHFAQVDVTDAEAVASCVDHTVGAHGRLDLLVNNAGIGVGGSSLELDLAHWDRAIDVNLRGVVHGTHAALKPMSKQGSGQIVNIASLAGLIPTAYLAPYVATKHAVVGMTLSMRSEFLDRGIGFTVVCPGYTDTPILDTKGPVDLPQIGSLPVIREVAEQLPGGIYEVASLAQDIMAGIDNNEAMVVTPRMARLAWESWRASPIDFMERAKR